MQPDREVLLPGRQALLQERLLPVSTSLASLCCSLPAGPSPASRGSEVSVTALGAAFGEGSQVPQAPTSSPAGRWAPGTWPCLHPGNCGSWLSCTCLGRKSLSPPRPRSPSKLGGRQHGLELCSPGCSLSQYAELSNNCILPASWAACPPG